MQFRWPSLPSLAAAAAFAAVFAVAGHFAANALHDAQRARQLHDLAEVALRRSEIAVDYGAATLDELMARGPTSCDAAALQAVRLTVYQRSAVKDIRVLSRDGGTVLCSAYSETLEFDKAWPKRDDMLPARDGSLRIFRVDQFFGVALGLLKDIDSERSLVAILGVNESLYDIMPTPLLGHSTVSLELGPGQPIIRSPASAAPPADAVRVTTVSQR
jgi:hypothetical protein